MQERPRNQDTSAHKLHFIQRAYGFQILQTIPGTSIYNSCTGIKPTRTPQCYSSAYPVTVLGTRSRNAPHLGSGSSTRTCKTFQRLNHHFPML